jgi:hypothetical protein
VLFRYTCHPTVLSSKIFQISADYPGVAQRVVESAYPGATAFFVQGCCGDVRPAIYRGDKFLGGTFGDVERMGRLLAAGVIRAAEQSAPVRGSGLDGRIRTLTLPFDSSMTPTRRNLDTLHRKYTRENKEWAGMGYVRKWTAFWRKQLAAGRRPQTGMPMDVHFIRIGEVTILGFGSEVMTEYGPWIRERVGGKLIVAGYANGVIGYLPTREALSQGGYEAVFHLFDNYPAPFAPEVQEMVIRAAEEIVKG